jgi:hypothetical protein
VALIAPRLSVLANPYPRMGMGRIARIECSSCAKPVLLYRPSSGEAEPANGEPTEQERRLLAALADLVELGEFGLAEAFADLQGARLVDARRVRRFNCPHCQAVHALG